MQRKFVTYFLNNQTFIYEIAPQTKNQQSNPLVLFLDKHTELTFLPFW